MGKTIKSLFDAFPKEELCQLYLHPSIPDVDACSSYYRITDRAILLSYISFRVKGEIIQADITKHESSDETKSGQLYRRIKNIGVTKKIARDFLWKFSFWYNKSLKSWIEQEAPTHLFVAPGMPTLLYDMAFRIAKKHKLKIITYICDDYYFLKKSHQLSVRYMNWRVRKNIEKLLSMSYHTVFICDLLAKAYNEKFDIESTTIMTGASRNISKAIESYPHVESLTYMGNLYYNRERSLAEIGTALESINFRYRTNFKLHIYTGEMSCETKRMFDEIPSIIIHNFVSGEEMERVFRESEAFIHVEGFDEESYDLVKFSVSTKIADSLSSAKVFFAYGPEGVASMQHLITNNCAFVATSSADLESKLEEIFFNETERIACVNRALNVSKKYHMTRKNSEKLYEIFENSDVKDLL